MRQDPAFITTKGERVGRDGCRVPLPWDTSSASLGFNTGSDLWLPQPADWKNLAASVQAEDSESSLSLTRKALSLRKELPALGGISTGVTPLEWDKATAGLLSYVRPARLGGNAIRVVMNTGSEPLEVPPSGELILESQAGSYNDGVIAPNATVWLWA